MTTKTIALGIAILGMTALSGCEMYYGDRNDGPRGGYSYCDETGCWYCDDWGCYPDDGDGGWGACVTNADCAAGCYCADGVCQEAGFCSYDYECPVGFVCDDRASCVPDGTNTGCESDADCPYGSYCDEASGVCLGSWTCTSDDDCGPGWGCDDRGTCVPEPCTSNDDCLGGCYCDTSIGECVETGTCTDSAECGEGMYCDDRNTCVPCGADGCPTDPTPGNCYEEALCDMVAPVCPTGTLPGVLDGCYTGFCIPEALCPDEPPFQCRDAADEAECMAAGCESVYVGIDCTDPDGGTCTGDETDCTCDRFEYGFCRDAAAP